jgi:glycosyltransferase involved in cell wall biosynthesis
MRRLLMIIPFFPPIAGGGVYRPLSFVKYLERHGWRTTVVAPRGDAFWIRDERLAEQVPPACEVIRTGVMSGQAVLSWMRRARGQIRAPQKRSFGAFSVVRRLAAGFLIPDTYIGWYPYAVRAARRVLIRRRFDAIYSTSPPETSHLVALKLHKLTGLPWVADFRDPWMNLYLLKPPTPLHAKLHRRLEKLVCERANAVVTTEWQEKLLREQYPRLKSVHRIPNGFDGTEVASVEALRPPAPPGRFRILHAGMLTQNRSAIPFLRALKRFLSRRPEVRGGIEALFVGPREDKNEHAVHDFGLSDVVEFRDSVPHEETLQLEKRSHILLLIKHVNPDYDGIVPGKLFEYIGVRRPILALVPDGEAKRHVESLKRGVTVAQDDIEAVAAKIEELFDEFRNGTLDAAFDLSPQPQFERSSLAGDLARLLGELTERKRE